MSYPRNAVGEYTRTGVQTGVESASPHRLIQMLLRGALEKIGAAQYAITNGDIAARGMNTSWAISIIDGLRASLDIDRGGDLALNLDQLYEFATRSLAEANRDCDAAKLETVAMVLGEIEAGWSAIGDEVESNSGLIENRALGGTAMAVG